MFAFSFSFFSLFVTAIYKPKLARELTREPNGSFSFFVSPKMAAIRFTSLSEEIIAQLLNDKVWRGILDKIVIRSCAVRHYIVLHNYVAGDTISYPMCCLIVMAMPLCRTTCCYIVPDNAIS